MSLENEIRKIIEDWLKNIVIKGILATEHANRFRLDAPIDAPPIASKLTRRSGRLIGSLGPKGTEESIRNITFKENIVTLEWGTNVPYAEIHEKGGSITVTPKMKKFMLMRYYQTKNPKWKYIAFANAVRIPPRPYFYPAVESSLQKIEDSKQKLIIKIAEKLTEYLKK